MRGRATHSEAFRTSLSAISDGELSVVSINEQQRTMMGCHAASLLVLAVLSLETSSFLLPVPVLPSIAFRRTAGGGAPAQSPAPRRVRGCKTVVRSTTDKVLQRAILSCDIYSSSYITIIQY